MGTARVGHIGAPYSRRTLGQLRLSHRRLRGIHEADEQMRMSLDLNGRLEE